MEESISVADLRKNIQWMKKMIDVVIHAIILF